MGTFVTKDDVKVLGTVEWPGWGTDETVTIQKYGVKDRDRLHEDILRVTGRAGSKLTEVEVSPAQIPVLLAGIRGWTLKGPDGELVPFNRDWVGRLDPEVADFLAEEIRELNKGWTEEEQTTF